MSASLLDLCGDETEVDGHLRDFYGRYLDCTRRRGHEGEHEHSESGVTWE